MHDLIEDMLAYSRMERSALEKRTLDLQALVRSVVESRRDTLAEDMTVREDVPPLEIRADRDGLTLVLRNLLENALKFSKGTPRAEVEVGARDTGTALRLWVRDHGIGFDMKYHDRIFEIFQRLHRAEDFPGTGVGLALVKKAVTRMGGKVWAESRPGEGAVFYIEFPL